MLRIIVQHTQILLYPSFHNIFFSLSFYLLFSFVAVGRSFVPHTKKQKTRMVFFMLMRDGDHLRNSHVIIPSIIKFLFYLSKQKDKKLITVPKIINITDTLLANGGNVVGCTTALQELAHEFFFQANATTMQTSGGSGSGNSGRDAAGDANAGTKTVADAESTLNRMEANTQKEVAFSMLLKFLEHSQVLLPLLYLSVVFYVRFFFVPRAFTCLILFA